MGVFAVDDTLRAAAIDAAHELGVFDALAAPLAIGQLAERLSLRATHRLAALLDALVALDALARDGAQVVCSSVPTRSATPLARTGWGAIADIIRTDRPIALDDPEVARRYQRHLVTASAPAAREVAQIMGTGPITEVVDIGGGAGAYTRALLEHAANMGTGPMTVTLVDMPAVVELAREELAEFGARVRFIEGDACAIDVSSDSASLSHVAGYDLALLANVLHLHSPTACADLCAVAARAVAPGGIVAVVDLRRGSLEGEMFALNMAIYTDGGSVYATDQIAAWLQAAGVGAVEERRLESAPEMVVVLGRRRVA